MASSKEYLNYVLENLKFTENVTVKKMMGEYLLYKDGVLFGGVYDDRFLIKNTPSNANYGLSTEIPYEGAKPMLLADFEDEENINAIINNAVSDLKKPL